VVKFKAAGEIGRPRSGRTACSSSIRRSAEN